MRFSRQPLPNVDEENPYWMSFSDIMASLLVVFILASVALVMQLTEQKETLSQEMQDLKKAEQVRKDILQEIKDELKAKNIVVETADNDTVLRIPEKALTFAVGRYDIPEDFAQNVQEIGNALFFAININDRESQKPRWQYLDTVFIEGHTDNSPYNNPYIKGNWGLSTFRAISVWEQWEDNPNEPSVQLSQMKNHLGDNLFSVSGYADTRPAYCNDQICTAKNEKFFSKADQDKNRRIDIRITVKKPTVEEIGNILGGRE